MPRARATAVGTTLLLAVLSLVLVGPRGVLTYVTAVLPAQALSELHFPFQYSLTYALAYLGLAPSAARIAGAISYPVLLVVGLLLAPTASAALRRRELLVFLPALAVLFGGPYLHQEELCFAIPAVAILATVTQGRMQALAAFALCLLSIPWILVWFVPRLFLASIFVCAVILLRLRIDLRLAVGMLCAIAAVIYAFELHPPRPPLPLSAPRAYAPNELAQNAWRDFAEAHSTRDVLWFAIKLPTWAALFAAIAVAVRCSLGNETGPSAEDPRSCCRVSPVRR